VTDTRNNAASIVERIRKVDAGAPVVGLHFLGATAVFVLGEEELVFAATDGVTRNPVHGGAILASAANAERVLTGGDDGKVVLTDAAGESVTVAIDEKRRWVDRVALAPDGAVAWSAGKSASVRTPKGELRSIEVPSSGGGLAFAPKGFRLAVAHYNGVTLWFPNAKAKPEFMEWKGSHLGVLFSPDGKFLITTMQEPALHGWRMADAKHMRMSGYSARVQSLAWTPGGRELATSGSEQLILWPFQSKDGPMGKQPRQFAPAPAQARVTAVACHPTQDVVAVGYSDGMVLLVRLADGAEILARRPDDAPVSALAWDAGGGQLGFGTEEGDAGLIAL
jgi:WD40 repeat protein